MNGGGLSSEGCSLVDEAAVWRERASVTSAQSRWSAAKQQNYKTALCIMRESGGDGPARQGVGLLTFAVLAIGRHPMLE